MRVPSLLILCISLLGCDRTSQRVWNCSGKKLDVLKTYEPGFEIIETIPARSWIGSMKGGAQITKITFADGNRTKILWRAGQAVLTSSANAADNVCAGRRNGVVVQQF